MTFAPDNFLYFITLFTISIFGGTYLLFSYYRNRLLILNILLFYSCAILACIEYYLPQIDSFTTATNVSIVHNIIAIIFGSCLWTCIWFYIRPFRGFKAEKKINSFYLYGIVGPLLLIGMYGFYHRMFYYFNPEKIGGYWVSTVDLDPLLTKFFLFQCAITMNVIVVVLFLIAIIRDRQDTVRLSLLLLFRIISPILYYSTITTVSQDNWNVPNITLMLLIECNITTWFVSNYRIFNDSFKAATSDLLNSISDLAVSTNTNLLVSNANAQAQSYLNIQQGNSVIGMLAENSSLTFQQISKKIKSLVQEKTKNFELSITDKKEEDRIFDIKVSPFKRGDQIEGYTFLLTDLSEIRQKEKELESLHETKDRLFAIISHDLRRPVLAFKGISKKVNHLIKKQEFERLDKFGTNIEKEAFSLSSLLDNLLSWALQQRSILPYDPVELKVKEVTASIHQLVHLIAEDKGITLVIKTEEPCIVFCDSNAFKSIIRNLVDNAIKYTPVGGTIEVSSVTRADSVVIKVSDTGIGMEQDTIDSIFDLKTAKSLQGTKGELGIGLGLSLVRDLVQLNKGTISVSSQWNEGTTFEIILPAAV